MFKIKRMVFFLVLSMYILTTQACNFQKINVLVTTRKIAQGSVDETLLYKIDTQKSGPTIFIIGGIHGNERAGWNAGLKMLQYEYSFGVTYVLPQANYQGAMQTLRYIDGYMDLNRSFPGIKEGNVTQRLAYTIFETIKEIKPDYLFDLHESWTNVGHQSGMGNSVIFSRSQEALFVVDVIDSFNALDIQKNQQPFTNLMTPPSGSINYEVSKALNIPTFTIETNRNDRSSSLGILEEKTPLEFRVNQQLQLLNLFLLKIYEQYS